MRTYKGLNNAKAMSNNGHYGPFDITAFELSKGQKALDKVMNYDASVFIL
jgi:hypothetical protein